MMSSRHDYIMLWLTERGDTQRSHPTFTISFGVLVIDGKEYRRRFHFNLRTDLSERKNGDLS